MQPEPLESSITAVVFQRVMDLKESEYIRDECDDKYGGSGRTQSHTEI